MTRTAGRSAGHTVAVFRESFLPPTETFIRDHLLTLPTWRPEVVTTGLRPDRLEVPGVPIHLAQRQGLAGRAQWRAARLLNRPSGDVLTGAVRRTFRDLAPDVVHAHFGPDTAVAALALRGLDIPLIGTFHGYDIMTRPEILVEYSYAARKLVEGGGALLRSLDAIVTVSTTLRDALVARGAEPEQISIIPCGVRTQDFTWSPPPATGPVLFVGRLVEKKGCEHLIRAMAGMPGAPTTVVIGTGPLEAALRALAADLRVDVEFRGSRTTAEVRQAMREAVIVAMPSVTAWNGNTEGMPVVSVEAGASGRPVVGFAHSGLTDSVLDGRTGLLATEGDTAGLRDRLAALLGDPERRLDFSRAAREHVVAHFDLKDCLTRLETVYDVVRARRAERAALGTRRA